MAQNAPGKHHRKGLTLAALLDNFPVGAAAEEWFVGECGPNRPTGPHCGHDVVQTGCARQKMPYRCRHRDCLRRFRGKAGTVMAVSYICCRLRAIATYVGGKAEDSSLRDRKRRTTGRDRLEKTPVAGVLDRATGYVGAYRHMSRVHLHRCVPKFADRHNVREMGTETQTEKVVGDMADKCLRYDDLIAA